MANLTVTIVIPDSKVARTKLRLLANRPNDRMIPDPINDGEFVHEFTDEEWFKFQLEEILRKWDKGGERILTEKLVKESLDSTDMFEE